MSKIQANSDQVDVLLSRTESVAADSANALAGFALTADGGLATDKIAFILQAAMEGAQLCVDASNAVTSVGRAAIDGQFEDEAEVYDALNNFSAEVFG